MNEEPDQTRRNKRMADTLRALAERLDSGQWNWIGGAVTLRGGEREPVAMFTDGRVTYGPPGEIKVEADLVLMPAELPTVGNPPADA